ncbi:hypothetical protein [Paenibacillus sp. GCM10027626]|uniref:hypothetical protein n=1 Tax=Paenibacillus sp. GCM10027626 TaxID=3273411 RepID=UPI0036396636
MRKKQLLFSILCLLVMTACSSTAPAPAEQSDKAGAAANTSKKEPENPGKKGMSSFDHQDFTINYPDTFKPVPEEEKQIAFLDDSPGQEQSRFTITVKEYEEGAPAVDKLLHYNISQLSELLHFSVDSRKDGHMYETATAAGVRALVYYQELDEADRDGTISVYHLLVPLESKLYILSYHYAKESYQAEKRNISKSAESIAFKHMPVTAWNTEDVDIESNGNIALAIAELKTYRSLNNGTKIKPADLFAAPWKYYGQAVTVEGKVEYVRSFDPIDGLRSEIVLETADGTLVDVIALNKAKDGLKVGHRTTLTGLPVGKGEVENAEGEKLTYVFLVGK